MISIGWGCKGAAIDLGKLILTLSADKCCPADRMGMILVQEARCLLDIPQAFE